MKKIDEYRRHREQLVKNEDAIRMSHILRRWRKAVMEMEDVKVIRRFIYYKEHYIGLGLLGDSQDCRRMLWAILYTIQVTKWDDNKYRFGYYDGKYAL